jgi:regulator of replication initiation timing
VRDIEARTRETEIEILRVRKDSERIRKETEQLRRENARLRIINAKAQSLLSLDYAAHSANRAPGP